MGLYSYSFGCNLTRRYLHNEHNPSIRDFRVQRKKDLETGVRKKYVDMLGTQAREIIQDKILDSRVKM